METIPETPTAAASGATSVDDRIPGIIALIHAAIRELRCLGSERMLRLGLSMSHLHVMSMVERHGEMTMSALAEALDVSLSNATGLIDRMEERGLVERCRVPDDRRVVLVRITESGRRLLTDADALRDDLMVQMLERLGPEALGRVDSALSELRAAAVAVLAAAPELQSHRHHTLDGHSHGHPAAAPDPRPVAASR